jgi:hypothetical protein
MDEILIEDETYRTIGNQPAEKKEMLKRDELRDPAAWGVGNANRPSIRSIGAEWFMAAQCAAFRNEKQRKLSPECGDRPRKCETCLRISVGFNINGFYSYRSDRFLSRRYTVSHIRCSTARHERSCAACQRREQGKATLRRLAAVKTR